MNLKKQKLKIPDGWQEVKSNFEKNYSYYVSPNGIIYDLLPESQLLVSRVDGSTIPVEFEQSMDGIYCKYQEIKTKEISCGAKKSVREQLNAYRQRQEPSNNVVKSQIKNRESLEK